MLSEFILALQKLLILVSKLMFAVSDYAYATPSLTNRNLTNGHVILPAINCNKIIANISNPRKNHKWGWKDWFVEIFSNKIVLTEFEMLDGHCFDLI